MKRPVLIIMMLTYFLVGNADDLRVDVHEVEDSVYVGREDITRLTIGSGVKSIGNFSFADCANLEEVIFEKECRLRSIGRYAFAGCKKLKCVKMPDSIEVLDEGVFRWCDELEYIEFSNTLLKLPRSVCSENFALKEVILPKKLKSIGSSAFMMCKSLQKIVLPQSLTAIGSNAFGMCASLTDINIPDSVTELESYVFAGCSSLKEVVLPANSSLLGELIFSDCPSLIRIVELSNIPPEFDCMSFPAEPNDLKFYERCVLEVSSDKIGRFRKAHGWNMFNNIVSSSSGNVRKRIR